jgi:hypothetical protein
MRALLAGNDPADAPSRILNIADSSWNQVDVRIAVEDHDPVTPGVVAGQTVPHRGSRRVVIVFSASRSTASSLAANATAICRRVALPPESMSVRSSTGW